VEAMAGLAACCLCEDARGLDREGTSAVMPAYGLAWQLCRRTAATTTDIANSLAGRGGLGSM